MQAKADKTRKAQLSSNYYEMCRNSKKDECNTEIQKQENTKWAEAANKAKSQSKKTNKYKQNDISPSESASNHLSRSQLQPAGNNIYPWLLEVWNKTPGIVSK